MGAEVLSRLMNNLHQHQHQLYKGFHMDYRGPQINHLSFTDDVIIFTFGIKTSLQLIMKTLSTYELVSDQLINRDKIHFMIPGETPQDTIDRIRDTTGFNEKESPITYLGCPLYIGKQRVIYFSDIVDKIVRRISGWQSRILSYGGKVTFLKYVLQSLPIHTLAAILPPKTTLKYIKRLTPDFLGGRIKRGKITIGRHGRHSVILLKKVVLVCVNYQMCALHFNLHFNLNSGGLLEPKTPYRVIF